MRNLLKPGYMDGKEQLLLFEDVVKINRSTFKVAVSVVEGGGKGELLYRALIDDVKEIEVSIDEYGAWYDVAGGPTDISKAIGDLIESKTT